MKVILSYGSYYNQGKKYQAKFIYDNEQETILVKNLIKTLNNKRNINIYFEKFSKNKKEKPIDVIGGTNIPNDILLQFISELIIMCKAQIIIGRQEFTTVDLVNIENAIDNLHINITLKKGKYFNFKDCYYAIFKYATDEQREEVSYDFNVNLNPIIGQTNSLDNDSYAFPFIADRNGNITGQNTGIIGGTNIPENALSFFIKRFISEYNAVITIGNEKFKNYTDLESIQEVIASLDTGKSRKRKKGA